MNFGRFLAILAVVLVGGFLAIKIIGALLGWAIHSLFAIAIPLALVVGIVYVVFRLTEKKALGNDKRGILP